MPHHIRRLSEAPNIVKEVDVVFAQALPKEHKHIVLRHFRRLHRIIDEEDEDAVGGYTTKAAAREQLARMTLVFRDYAERFKRGECDEDGFESMVADVVDASLFVGGRQGSFEQPAFANALLAGREQEVAILMQELEAGNVDDVIELWNVRSPAKSVVPDSGAEVVNIGEGIDWTTALCRARTEDNYLHKYGSLVVIEDRPKWTRSLSYRKISALHHNWPLSAPEENEVRKRLSADMGLTDWSNDVYD